ncbi:MAG: DUF1461 domain-containing protein [Chloroflexi bacterium]|nr:MAG: DUF1461 domain-containing protein [Chloroflexota bacterium]
MQNSTMVTIVRWLVTLAMPIFLGFTTIVLIIRPAYPRYEYGKANFPPDPYGFTPEQRLSLALVAVDYLRRPEPAEEVIFMLEDQRLPGTDQPLYNEREIKHMIDVKHLTDAIRRIDWVAAILVVGGLAFLFWRPETRVAGYRAMLQGGILTTAILLGIALFILVGWNLFFVQFHELLFPPGTWTFAYSDSLIRLFPEKFWFDLGVILSVGTLLEGVITAVLGYVLWKRVM